MNDRPIKDKPDIEYPCQWIFKVFGTDEGMLREDIAGIMPGSSYELTLSRSSSRYLCMNLTLTVVSDLDRTAVYEALKAHERILLVL